MTTPTPPSGPTPAEQAIRDQFIARYHGTVHCLCQFWRYRAGPGREVPLDALHAELVTLIEGTHAFPYLLARRLLATLPDMLRIELNSSRPIAGPAAEQP